MTVRIILGVAVLVALALLFVALRPSPSEAPQARTIDVMIEGNTMTPSRITVGQGDDVTLRVTADLEMNLHVHGYDLEEHLETGETKAVVFEADRSGSFEIENEDTKTLLGALDVQPR